MNLTVVLIKDNGIKASVKIELFMQNGVVVRNTGKCAISQKQLQVIHRPTQLQKDKKESPPKFLPSLSDET